MAFWAKPTSFVSGCSFDTPPFKLKSDTRFQLANNGSRNNDVMCLTRCLMHSILGFVLYGSILNQKIPCSLWIFTSNLYSIDSILLVFPPIFLACLLDVITKKEAWKYQKSCVPSELWESIKQNYKIKSQFEMDTLRCDCGWEAWKKKYLLCYAQGNSELLLTRNKIPIITKPP